jgi:hypothetical protein
MQPAALNVSEWRLALNVNEWRLALNVNECKLQSEWL